MVTFIILSTFQFPCWYPHFQNMQRKWLAFGITLRTKYSAEKKSWHLYFLFWSLKKYYEASAWGAGVLDLAQTCGIAGNFGWGSGRRRVGKNCLTYWESSSSGLWGRNNKYPLIMLWHSFHIQTFEPVAEEERSWMISRREIIFHKSDVWQISQCARNKYFLKQKAKTHVSGNLAMFLRVI